MNSDVSIYENEFDFDYFYVIKFDFLNALLVLLLKSGSFQFSLTKFIKTYIYCQTNVDSVRCSSHNTVTQLNSQ